MIKLYLEKNIVDSDKVSIKKDTTTLLNGKTVPHCVIEFGSNKLLVFRGGYFAPIFTVDKIIFQYYTDKDIEFFIFVTSGNSTVSITCDVYITSFMNDTVSVSNYPIGDSDKYTVLFDEYDILKSEVN